MFQDQWSSRYISTATTTTAKTGTGQLGSIIVTGGTAGTIIIYDNTAASGTILASFSSTNAIEQYDFKGIPFYTGLTIVTGAATQLTVIFR